VSRNHASSYVSWLDTSEESTKFHSRSVVRIEMQLHFYATARRRFLKKDARECCEFPARYYSHAGNSNSLSPYRDASVPHSSWLNQNSQDVTKTGALNSVSCRMVKRNGSLFLYFVNFVKSLERITILLF